MEVTYDHYLVILRRILGLFEFLVCQVLGFNNRTNCREGEDSKASPSLAWPGIAIHRLSGYSSTKKFPPSQYSLKHSGTVVAGLFLLWGIQIFKGYQWGQRPAVEMPLIRVSSSPRVEVAEGPLVARAILTGNDVAFGVDCVLPSRGVERHPLGEQRGVLHATTKIFARTQWKLLVVPETQNFTTKPDHVFFTTEIQPASTLFLRDKRSVPDCVLLKSSHAVAHYFYHTRPCVTCYMVMHYDSADNLVYKHFTCYWVGCALENLLLECSSFWCTLAFIWRYVTTLIIFHLYHGVQALGSVYLKLLCVSKVPSVGILSSSCCSRKITLNCSLPEVRTFPLLQRKRLCRSPSSVVPFSTTREDCEYRVFRPLGSRDTFMVPIDILITIGMLVLYFAAVTTGAVKDVVRAMPFPPPPSAS